MRPDIMKLKVTHVITGLQVGGAEMMLCRLLEHMDLSRFECSVICLGPRGPLAERVAAAGIPLTCLGLGGPHTLLRGLRQLTKIFRATQPGAVHTWMYHADLLGGLAARRAGVPVTWALHHSHAAGGMKRMTKAIVKLNAWLSRRVPQRIVCCSESARTAHAGLGYDAGRMELIFNGADTQTFVPDASARSALRAELGIPAEAPVVGFVGRCVPVKDLPTFLAAAALVQQQRPDAHFILCGPDMEQAPENVKAAMAALPKPAQLHAVPFRRDVHRVYPAFDLFALTSLSEACPMSIIEAMSCGVLCASTDAGDSAVLIGDRSVISPPGDAAHIARVWLERLSLPPDLRSAAQQSARQRVEHHFSMERCVNAYCSLYARLAGRALPVSASAAPLPA